VGAAFVKVVSDDQPSRRSPVDGPRTRADLLGHGVELVSGGRCGRLPRVQPEPVPGVSRDDVQVEVKDLLERGLTVGEEQVDGLAAQPGPSGSGGEPPRR
jgi:hypothetical protein